MSKNVPKPCYLRSFLHLGFKKHRKYRYFWAKKRKKRDTYEVFCTLRQKPRYLQCFLHMALQKHRYLQYFCNISRCCLSTPKLQKHCILQCFALWNLQKNASKMVQKPSPKTAFSDPWFFGEFPTIFWFPQDPQKTPKHQQYEGF